MKSTAKEMLANYSKESAIFRRSMPSIPQKLSSNIILLFPTPYHKHELLPSISVNLEFLFEKFSILPDKFE